MSDMNFEIDDKLSTDVQRVFDKLEIDIETAINLYFEEIVKTKSIPFDISLNKSEIDIALEDIEK